MKTNKFLTIFLFEIRRNLKMVVIWSVSISLLSVITLLSFNFFKDQAASLTKALEGFPPEFLEAFGASPTSFAEINGYFISKFLSMFVIINAIFGAYLASAITGKEINDTSIVQLFMKKISRTKILLAKYLNFLILLAISNLVVFLISYLTARVSTSEIISFRFFFVAFTGAYIVELFFATLAMLVSIVYNENTGLFSSIGLTLGMFIIDGFSRTKGMPEFIKYLTPYYYLDLNGLTNTKSLDPGNMAFLLGLTTIILIAAIYFFRRKNLNI